MYLSYGGEYFMRIVFFSGYAISHLIPLKSTISYLKDMGFDIYLFGTEKNKWFGKKLNVNYNNYPDNYWKPVLSNEATKLNKDIEKYYHEKDYVSMMKYILKKDAMLAFNHNENVINTLKSEIYNISPEVVYRDSTDIYWSILKKDFSNIKTIGYITNNLYNWNYLFSHMKNFSYFLGINDIQDKLPSHFLYSFKRNIDNIYKEIQNEYSTYPLRAYYQYDPDEDFNLIYSSKYIQPNDCYDVSKYFIVEPDNKEMCIENYIEKNLIDFLKDSETIYISTGSFISRDMNFYILIIKMLKDIGNYKIVISAGKNYEKLFSFIKENNEENDIYVSSFIPQKYILKNNCRLFINSGGINSIKESIYFGVPMFIIPISCEQRLNGLLLEEFGIGYTSYGPNNRLIDLKKNLEELISSNEIKSNLKKLQLLLHRENNIITFKKMLDYINKK